MGVVAAVNDGGKAIAWALTAKCDALFVAVQQAFLEIVEVGHIIANLEIIAFVAIDKLFDRKLVLVAIVIFIILLDHPGANAAGAEHQANIAGAFAVVFDDDKDIGFRMFRIDQHKRRDAVFPGRKTVDVLSDCVKCIYM